MAENAKQDDSRSPNERLADVLNDSPIPQVQVAERIGVTESYLSAVKNGRATLTRKTASAIERAFGIRAAWLLHGEQPVAVAYLGDDTWRTVVDLPSPGQPAQPPAAEPGTPAVADVLMVLVPKCGRCRGQVERGATACPHCGIALRWHSEDAATGS